MNRESIFCTFSLLSLLSVGFISLPQSATNQDDQDRWEYAQLYYVYDYGVYPGANGESGEHLWSWTDPTEQVKSESYLEIAQKRFDHPEDQPLRSVIDIVNYAAEEGWDLVNVSESVKCYGELVNGVLMCRWTFKRRLDP